MLIEVSLNLTHPRCPASPHSTACATESHIAAKDPRFTASCDPLEHPSSPVRPETSALASPAQQLRVRRETRDSSASANTSTSNYGLGRPPSLPFTHLPYSTLPYGWTTVDLLRCSVSFVPHSLREVCEVFLRTNANGHHRGPNPAAW